MTMIEEKANILIVDDQPNNLLALEAILSDLGENLVTAGSGDEALRFLLERDFALILLDVQMPNIDGFETARLIRRRERARHIPIIFITALSRNESNVFRGYSLGAVDYLFKPIVPEILRSKVMFFVELHKKTQAIRQQSIELQRLSRQNELILSSAADAVLGLDSEGKLTFANPSVRRLLGLSPTEVLDRPIHELIHSNPSVAGCEGEECSFMEILRGDETVDSAEATFCRSDATCFPAEFSVGRMRNEEGKVFGTVLTFRDVSERQAVALARENERLYREAEAANRAKDEFLATLSHELRTPMTAILGWLDLLGLDEPTDAELLREGLDTIRRSARLQAQLIDDMLDVSRIITGKFLLDRKPTSLSDVVVGALETVRPTANEKRISIETDIDGDVQVIGDPMRLKQVFWNVLSNAVKFTEADGRVSVSTSVLDHEARVIVQDSGVGIDPDFLPHIFGRLEQSSHARKYGGLGLGLAIAQHIVESHGGTIYAESAGPGKGSTFVVSLPRWDAADQSAGHPVGAASEA